MVSKHLVEKYNMESSQAQSLCQLTLPVAAQFIAGPLHFLGLDFFNRQQPSVNVMDRVRVLQEGIGPVVAARIARIAPGYGIGGVWNTKLRTAWREELLEQTNQQQHRRRHQRGEPYLALLLDLVKGGKIPASVA